MTDRAPIVPRARRAGDQPIACARDLPDPGRPPEARSVAFLLNRNPYHIEYHARPPAAPPPGDGAAIPAAEGPGVFWLVPGRSPWAVGAT
jgi:hypothetical protein